MSEMNETKTTEEMNEMTVMELRDYISDLYSHIKDVKAIRDYRMRIGEPKLLIEPTEVEFEEEE